MKPVSFAKLIKSGLDPSSPRTMGEVLTFLLGFLTFEMGVHESAPALPGLACRLTNLCEEMSGWKHGLEAAAWYFGFFLVFVAIPVFRPRRPITVIGQPQSPPPMRGLIASLSKFNPYSSSLLTVDAMKERVQQVRKDHPLNIEKLGDLRTEVLASNLGPLFAALQHHEPELRHCWLTYTPESEPILPVAKDLVKLLCPQATPHEVKLHDAHNVQAIAQRVRQVYDGSIGNRNLKPEEVIVDITGGNVTMSAGLVLASLDENRKVQYLLQTRRLAEKKGDRLTSLSTEEVAALLQYVRTSPGDVQYVAGEREA